MRILMKMNADIAKLVFKIKFFYKSFSNINNFKSVINEVRALYIRKAESETLFSPVCGIRNYLQDPDPQLKFQIRFRKGF